MSKLNGSRLCVEKTFSGAFDLPNFNGIDKEEIMRCVYSYVLGLNTYSIVYKELREFELSNTFSRVLRSLDFERIKYVIFSFRKGVKIRKKSLITKEDRKWVDRLKKDIRYSKIKMLQRFPHQDKVLTCVMPNILNTASNLYASTRWDKSLERADLVNELSLKAIQAYRIYVFGYGYNNFNAKVLLSCVYKGINTRKKDFLTMLHKKKREVVKHSCSLDNLLEQNMEQRFLL